MRWEGVYLGDIQESLLQFNEKCWFPCVLDDGCVFNNKRHVVLFPTVNFGLCFFVVSAILKLLPFPFIDSHVTVFSVRLCPFWIAFQNAKLKNWRKSGPRSNHDIFLFGFRNNWSLKANLDSDAKQERHQTKGLMNRTMVRTCVLNLGTFLSRPPQNNNVKCQSRTYFGDREP